MKFTRITDSTKISVIQQKNIVTQSKNTGPVSFTGKHLKVLKNSSGLKNEIELSLTFHATGIPLLVSPALLRLRNLGQIDLARLKKDQQGWMVEIGEVKSSVIGEEQMERFQKKRLYSTQHFLAGLFGYRTKLSSFLP